MDWTANVAVHESATPGFIRDQVFSALQKNTVHPYLLYSGLRQTGLWVELYRAFSPAQRDASCLEMYEAAFDRAIQALPGNVAHLVSLACGDGSKDLRCLQRVRASHRTVIYTPVDLSLEMVLGATRAAGEGIRGLQATPLLCDLPNCSVLPAILKAFDPSGAERLMLFLGTIHNFWPPDILRSILYPLRSQDQLLLSANLAPEERYEAALAGVLEQYNNPPTRRWLLGGLSELGLSETDGDLLFGLRPTATPGLKRIDVAFKLRRATRIRVYDREWEMATGEELSVFYSHRFTQAHIKHFLEKAGLAVSESWVGAGGCEGLFLCKRAQ